MSVEQFNTLLKATPLGKALSFSSVGEFGEMRRYIESESLPKIYRLSVASDFSRVLSRRFEEAQGNPSDLLLPPMEIRPERPRHITGEYLNYLQQNRHDPRLQWV
jgi:hypothetical protein